jgi:proline/betaine transport protein TphA
MRTKINVLGGLLGNSIEWFDFILYVYFAPIFSTLFFPTKSEYISLIITFGVFASGFFMRPIGGFILGLYGDRYGRKAVLILTISSASLATFLIAFLPTYSKAGIIAPLLLTLLRLLQGFSVSGELNCSAAFLIEHVNKKHRGFAGSLITCTALSGLLLASSLVALITYLMPHSQLISFGWRIPFCFAGLLGLIGLLVRLKTDETPEFLATEDIQRRNSKFNLFKQYSHLIIATILITFVAAVGDYFFIGYFTVFLTKTGGFQLKTAALINTIAMIILILSVLFSGFLSDKIGKRFLFAISAGFIAIFSYPIIYLFTLHSIAYAFLGEMLFVIILAPVAGLIPPILAELFPTNVRNSGSTIGYNIGMALFGGTAPLVAITLVNLTKNPLEAAWYLIISAFISLLTIVLVGIKRREGL